MFTFYADPKELVAEHHAQFTNLGTSAKIISEVTPWLDDLWNDGPGGWVYEWSRVAEECESHGDWMQASLLYGIAKYPCLANPARGRAYALQLKNYLRAAPRFPMKFRRRTISVPYQRGKTEVAIHLLSPPGANAATPVLMMLGGIDTWKMDIHHTAIQVGSTLGAHVALVDMPGVGESQVANAADGDVVLAGVAQRLRSIGNGRVGVFGFSFGASWAVKLALTAQVDAAAASGAPIADAFDEAFLAKLPGATAGVIGNSFHRTSAFRDSAELAAALAPFNLRSQGLMNWRIRSTPLYLFNGDLDPYIPSSDLVAFHHRPNTVVRLVSEATHCAAEKLDEVMPDIIIWLGRHLRKPAARPSAASSGRSKDAVHRAWRWLLRPIR